MVLSLFCPQVAESVISSTAVDILAMFRDQMKSLALPLRAKALYNWHSLKQNSGIPR
jgi:hypothetical protein